MIGLDGFFKLGKGLVCKEVVWIGEYDWSIEGITVGTILGYIEGFYEHSSFGITELYPEGVENGSLHGLKDNIKDGDKQRIILRSPRFHFWWHNEDNYVGKSEDFPIRNTNAVSLGRFESSMLFLSDFPNLEKSLDVKKVNELVNMSDILKVLL